MFKLNLLLLCVLFSRTIGVLSQDPQTFFFNPLSSNNTNVFPIGLQTAVAWSTDLPSYDIFLWQQQLTAQKNRIGSQPVYSKSGIIMITIAPRRKPCESLKLCYS